MVMVMVLLIVSVVLAMVLIENVLTLLLMIEPPERKPTTAMAMVMATVKQQSHTVSGVAVERGPAIVTIMTMIDVSAINMTSSTPDARDNTINNT